jgi:hypothetical protein
LESESKDLAIPPYILEKSRKLGITYEKLTVGYLKNILDKERNDEVSLEDELNTLNNKRFELDREKGVLKRKLFDELTKNQIIAISCGARYASNSMMRRKFNLKPHKMDGFFNYFLSKYLEL